ncbi:MAG: hypothetical protein CMP49_06135 [Flavobacteriales bacterium]|nr:hypothetical protein [Flavobacteriales bacterium]
MNKNIAYYLIIIMSVSFLSAQELFIQETDKVKGSKRIKGKDYVTVYDNTNHRYRYFDENGKEIFLIKSFNEDGDQVGLSIEKNPTTESVEIIVNNNVIVFVLNSTIYNSDMVEIGKLFGGRYSQKNINDFWEGIDYSRGNISIYDHTGIYKIGSLYYTPFIDHYAILGIDKIEDIENMDARTLKKTIRNMQRLYKRLMREYNIKRNPDDKEIQSKAAEITNSYLEVMNDLGFSEKKEKKILGFLPADHFNEEKRSKWSDTEGYVPAIKRDIKGHQPDSQIQKEELYYSNE